MGKDIRLAFVILLISSGAAVATNAMRTGTKKVPWFGKELVARPDITGAGGITTQPVIQKDATGTEYVPIDQVLKHLELQDALFVDARKPEEYAQGHIRGAVNLPSSSVFENIQVVIQNVSSPEQLVIVYCGGGECEASHEVKNALKSDVGGGKAIIDNPVKIFHEGWNGVMAPGGKFDAFIVVGDMP